MTADSFYRGCDRRPIPTATNRFLIGTQDSRELLQYRQHHRQHRRQQSERCLQTHCRRLRRAEGEVGGVDALGAHVRTAARHGGVATLSLGEDAATTVVADGGAVERGLYP